MRKILYGIYQKLRVRVIHKFFHQHALLLFLFLDTDINVTQKSSNNCLVNLMMNLVLNCKFHLGIVLILADCFTSVPYVSNKCFVTATCQQFFHSKIKGARYIRINTVPYFPHLNH